MLYVTATAAMAEISAVMGASFATLGQFFGLSGIVPVGPPLAVYHDWSADKTAVDVGFPVSAADVTKASGAILGGTTPGGSALKTVHVGPYDDFPATYAAIAAAMKAAGIPDSTRMWEVYKNEPGTTPDAELVTEIYVSVSPSDATKFPG
jgi:effector-binding domain-containing protein